MKSFKPHLKRRNVTWHCGNDRDGWYYAIFDDSPRAAFYAWLGVIGI